MERWDVYDLDRRPTGRILPRGEGSRRSCVSW